MAGSSMGRIALAAAFAAALGGGFLVWKGYAENRRLELKAAAARAAADRARAEGQAAEAAARENAKAKEAEARIKEAAQKKAADERATAKANADAKKAAAEAENLKLKNAQEEIAKAKARKAAAEAEAEKAKAQKAAAEATRAEQERKVAAERLARERAEAAARKAAAEQATAEAARRAAEAAREKSENERRTAEANAAAEHDRKLRLYQRAGTSRAELVALRRAEKRLALEEAGLLEDEGESEGADEAKGAAAEAEKPAATNAVAAAAVRWPDADDAADGRAAPEDRSDALRRQRERRAARRDVRELGDLANRAEAEGRAADAARFRAAIKTFAPDYVALYADAISEAKAAGKADEARALLGDLFKVVPEWERADVVVRLLERDEAHYSEALAGRVPKSVYVSAFRTLYDRTRRDVESDGADGRNPRAERMQHLREVLARFVPDYERVYEWSGRYEAETTE